MHRPRWLSGLTLFAWMVFALGLVLTVAAQATTLDITSQFAITRSGFVLNRSTNTFDSTISLKNISGAPVLAPISVVVSGLPNSVTLANKTGQTTDGKPYMSPMAAGTLLQPGGTLSFVLKFANPQRVTITSILQILYTVVVPANAPSLISVVATGGTNAYLIGRVDGAPSQSITLQAWSAATCVFGTLVGGVAGVPVMTTTDASGYFGVSVAGVNPGAFVAVQVTAPMATQMSACLVSARDNDSWPNAFPLDGSPMTAQDLIDAPGKARWYKFSITPGQTIQVTLTNLPADYDLDVFKDIAQTFAKQFQPGSASSVDLLTLTAEYAPSTFSPSTFSPSTFSPSTFSPSTFSPSTFSPSTFSPSTFSPSTFSPSTFSPSTFSPSTFSPSTFSPSVFTAAQIAQAFSTAQTLSVVAVSAIPGVSDKSLVVNTWNNTGNFYVRVVGHGAAFNTSSPFTVTVTEGPTTCTAVTDTTLTPRPVVTATGLNTVILTDSSAIALDATLPGPAGGTLRTTLAAFAQRSEINGVVVDVAGDARVSTLKQQAANNPACPFAENLVAQEIKGIVDSYRANPLQYVVIVGDDSVIPFFRSPDESMLGEESEYVPPVQSDSPSEASLSLNFVLSQDAYGSNTTVSLPSNDFPVPGLAVGRLVKEPPEIAGVLDAYVAANGVVVPGSSLVTGYDFLAQAATAVTTELASGIGATSGPMDTLITPDGVSAQDTNPYPAGPWTATDLAGLLFGARHDVIFLAGHFSANNTLAADFSTTLVTTDLAASTTDFTNAIVFSAGCHAGYDIVDKDAISGVTLTLDWAQAFAQKQATFIAGTGYQYGDTDFIEYNAQIYINFARELHAGTGPIAVGAALVAGKLDYLATTPHLRGIPEKALLETSLYGLPMLGVNMPSGRGAGGGGATITPVAVASGPASSLGLDTYDLSVAQSQYPLSPHTISLTNAQGGPNVTASWLSGPDGVVNSPGEPALPLVAVNVTPNDPSLVLRGIGFRGGTYVDSGPLYPFSGAPATELSSPHVPFISPVFYPAPMWTPNYFGALAGSGGTELLVTPTQYIAADPVAGTSTQREYTDLDLRLYYSGNLTQAALSDAPSIVSVGAEPNAGGVLFTVQVTGDPAAAVYQVWITYTSAGGNAWIPLDLSQCVAPLPAGCGATENSQLWVGQLASVPTNLQYVVQAASGVGLVALDDNRGAYYLLAGLTPEATTLALVSPPTSAKIGDNLTITAQLTFGGVPVAGKTVVMAIGDTTEVGTTGSDGRVTVTAPVAAAPGSYQITAAFAGDNVFQESSTSASFAVGLAPSSLAALAPAGATLTGTLGGVTEAVQGEAVSFSVTGPPGPLTVWANTDNLGRAILPPPGLPAGTYTVTQAAFAGDATFAATSLPLTQQFIVPKIAQSITFDALADMDYGDANFAVYASASSGLAVSFAASGTCSVAGNTVRIGYVGSCTITASQPGDSDYNAATPQSRTFMIDAATQAITFAPVPTNATVGQPFIVSATSSSATSAPSTMPITFSSQTPLVCTTGGINGAMVTFLAPGTCTIAASQIGDPNYNAASPATESFTVAAATSSPATFTVTNLSDSGAGSLRSAIAQANAAPGSTVNFGVTGTIVLTSGQIQIAGPMFIIGPAASSLTINGNANSRIFSIYATSTTCPGVQEPGPDYLVSISGLTLTNAGANFAGSYGGAIFSGHSLALDSVIIENSSARSGGGVGFVIQFPGQTLTITNSQFLNNVATPTVPPTPTYSNDGGGGLAVSEYCTNLQMTTPVAVTIASSLFSGNSSRPLNSQPVSLNGRGGAIRLYSLADITISDTRIVGNHVDAPNPPVTGLVYRGGGIEGGAKSLRIERSEISNNFTTDTTSSGVTRGGGVAITSDQSNLQTPSSAMAFRIINSTISGNTDATNGGGLWVFGNVAFTLDNSTISNNTAATATGGIRITTGATSPATASDAATPTLTIVSSIVAGNTSDDIGVNFATIPSFTVNASHSLFGTICQSQACVASVAGPKNFIGANPLLGPLGFNGGPTQTQPLQVGSPAIATGSNQLGLATDQRGTGFPRASATGAVDMGAYELSQ